MPESYPLKTVSVIGLGYIGLPTAAMIASCGLTVAGVDINPDVVDTVNKGHVHIAEPALDPIVSRAVSDGSLKAYRAPIAADIFLIAVPTPLTARKTADLGAVMAAGQAIAPVLKKGDLVILESTSPVGTTETLAAMMAALRPDLTFPVLQSEGCHPDTFNASDKPSDNKPRAAQRAYDVNVAYCPERVLPGNIMKELATNDRAIGGMSPHCTQQATALYQHFVTGDLIATDVRTAELCKLAENAFRDVNIAFANELANVCDAMDINVWDVIGLANRHPRVDILRPGPGVGGHCIAVDPWFLVESAPDCTPLIQAARHINDNRPQHVTDQIQKASQKSGHCLTIALLGLTFKPNIDDLRESPALDVALRTRRASLGDVLVVEPHIRALPDHLREAGLTLTTLDDALARADVIGLLVDHNTFKDIPKSRLDGRPVIDTRGLWT